MIFRWFYILVLAATLASSTARSATTTIGASKDNSIYQSAVNNSAGGAAGIFTGGNGASSPRRGLLEFDIAASVSAGATITGAQLIMHLGAGTGSATPSIGLHRLTSDWGEGTAGSSSPNVSGGGNGFAASAGDATWNERFMGSATWSSAGATGDFNPVVSDTLIVPNIVDKPDYIWGSTAAMVADVQSWLDSPGTNFGWALINASETSPSVRAFYSRSATLDSLGNPLDISWRPRLTIAYQAAIPEPLSAMLLLWTGPLFLVRRRR